MSEQPPVEPAPDLEPVEPAPEPPPEGGPELDPAGAGDDELVNEPVHVDTMVPTGPPAGGA